MSRPPRSGKSSDPKGTYWLYGRHAVQAALANPERHIHQARLTRENETLFAADLASRGIRPRIVSRQELDPLCGPDAVHQGAALQVSPLPPAILEDVAAAEGLILVLDQVSDPRNVGAILRSAAAFGAAGIVMQQRNAPEETGAIARAASGALDRVPICREVNLARALEQLKKSGRWVVGLDTGRTALRGDNFKNRRTALVLGAEGAGLRRLTEEKCDEMASIPIHSAMESLNVSTAAAIALYEMTRG